MPSPGRSLAELARASGSPVVDDGGATFVWLEPGPPPVVFGDWCHWDPEQGLHMAPADEGWSARLPLPADAYVEYALIRDGQRVRDPLNPHRVDNGFRRWNEQLWMPRASRRAAALQAQRVRRGTLTRGEIELGWRAAPPSRRRLDLYLPAGVAPSEAPDLPLLVVLDGADYVDRGRLPRTLDALIARGAMAPVAAAFLDTAHEARTAELAANDYTLAVLVDEVVPAAEARLGLAPVRSDGDSGRAVILGSSMGGLMALHAGAWRSDVFGGAIAQSTSVGFQDLTLPDGRVIPPVRLTTLALAEAAPAPPTRLWLDAQDLEWLAEPNDELAVRLRSRGWDVAYRRYPGGHNQTSWGEALVDALPHVFPPAAPGGHGVHPVGDGAPAPSAG